MTTINSDLCCSYSEVDYIAAHYTAYIVNYSILMVTNQAILVDLLH